MGFKQLCYSLDELVVVLVDVLVRGFGDFRQVNRSSDYRVNWCSARNQSVAVLEEAATNEFGGRDPGHVLHKVLPPT